MSLLAAPIQFDDPPPAYLQSVPDSFFVKKLGWCGLTLGTREGYTTATTSYKIFCMLRGWKPWPATIKPIWVGGATCFRQKFIKTRSSTTQYGSKLSIRLAILPYWSPLASHRFWKPQTRSNSSGRAKSFSKSPKRSIPNYNRNSWTYYSYSSDFQGWL